MNNELFGIFFGGRGRLGGVADALQTLRPDGARHVAPLGLWLHVGSLFYRRYALTGLVGLRWDILLQTCRFYGAGMAPEEPYVCRKLPEPYLSPGRGEMYVDRSTGTCPYYNYAIWHKDQGLMWRPNEAGRV